MLLREIGSMRLIGNERSEFSKRGMAWEFGSSDDLSFLLGSMNLYLLQMN